MKTKILLYISILFFSVHTFSQQMGSIDIITPSKTANGIAKQWTIYNMTGSYGNSLQFWAYDNLSCVPGGMCTNRFTIMDNGNVGIGTINPLTKLHVDGDISTSVNGSIGFNTSDTFSAYGGNRPHYGLGYSVSGNPLTLSGYYGLSLFTLGYERLRIDAVGNVGIGTNSPDEKLTVKGKIHTQEVRVDMTGPLVPDYVFANDYKLKTLQEVEAYIKENSHLPEIPSAKEIEKNGLMLAEMNMALLKKMEEMTLYMIEQNKKLEIQQTENIKQSEEIIKLKEANESYKVITERISKLENQLKN